MGRSLNGRPPVVGAVTDEIRGRGVAADQRRQATVGDGRAPDLVIEAVAGEVDHHARSLAGRRRASEAGAGASDRGQ